MVKIAGARMMDGMAGFPIVIWRQGQDTYDPPGPVIPVPASKEGSVSAIVLDHEQPHQKASGGEHEQAIEPELFELQCQQHRAPRDGEWKCRDHQFNHASTRARLPIGLQFSQPRKCLRIR